MILGRRYQESKHVGNMMGMAFEGVSVTDYNNAKKVFVNMGRQCGFRYDDLEGTWDENTKSINSTGKAVDPMTGKEVSIRGTLKIIDGNTQSLEVDSPCYLNSEP